MENWRFNLDDVMSAFKAGLGIGAKPTRSDDDHELHAAILAAGQAEHARDRASDALQDLANVLQEFGLPPKPASLRELLAGLVGQRQEAADRFNDAARRLREVSKPPFPGELKEPEISREAELLGRVADMEGRSTFLQIELEASKKANEGLQAVLKDITAVLQEFGITPNPEHLRANLAAFQKVIDERIGKFKEGGSGSRTPLATGDSAMLDKCKAALGSSKYQMLGLVDGIKKAVADATMSEVQIEESFKIFAKAGLRVDESARIHDVLQWLLSVGERVPGDVLSCPVCSAKTHVVSRHGRVFDDAHFVACDGKGCNYTGPIYQSENEAIRYHNLAVMVRRKEG